MLVGFNVLSQFYWSDELDYFLFVRGNSHWITQDRKLSVFKVSNMLHFFYQVKTCHIEITDL